MRKKPVYIIAEIGINHNGSLETAKQLIDVAKVSGCDCVKFQKREPDICVPNHQRDKLRQTPWGEMKYIDYKHKMEFGKKEYDEIDRYCKERGIDWTVSVWDVVSVDFLGQYDVPFIKIPSAQLTNDALLEKVAKQGRKIVLSVGMSTLSEIDHAVSVLYNNGVDVKCESAFALLHCNSAYPAPLEQLNLARLGTLKNRYFCEVGYSGHEFRLVTTVASIYLGATIIERHITLDRSMWGSDHLGSVEPQGLIKLVRGIRELEQAYGTSSIAVTLSEKSSRKKLRG